MGHCNAENPQRKNGSDDYCSPKQSEVEPAAINRQASFVRRLPERNGRDKPASLFRAPPPSATSSRNKPPFGALLRLLCGVSIFLETPRGARKKLAGLSCPVLLANGWRSTKLSEKLYRNRCLCLLNPLKMRLFNRFINSLPKQNESQK